MHLMRSLILLTSSIIVSSTGLAACAGPDAAEEDVRSAVQDGLSMNGLSMSALTTSSLSTNGPALSGLTKNSLTTSGLMATSSIAATLEADPLSQLFMAYVVSCALTSAQTVEIASPLVTYAYPGGLGLAPEWGLAGGSCNTSCQQWVSACVISRVNALGQHVPLSERGENPGLALAPGEATDYPDREATYFGNVLVSPQRRFACRATEDNQTLIGRVCGDGADVSGCAVDVLGNCHALCATNNADGSFAGCAAPTATGGFFPQAVTVYRLPQ